MMLNKWTSKIKNNCLAKEYAELTNLSQVDIHILVRLIYPHGAWVKFDNKNINKMYQQTKQLSWYNDVIYDGVALLFSDLYALVDVLYRDKQHKWNIVEAYDKDTAVADIINDMAFKKFVFEQADFPIHKCIALKMLGCKTDKTINVKDLFEVVDVTKDMVGVYKLFKTALKQNLEPDSNENKTFKSDNAAYVDYSQYNAVETYRDDLIQSNCRILIDNHMHHFKPYLWHSAENIYCAQIDFLIRNTEQADKVYVYNYEFEQAHYRQMAKMFPDKAYNLAVLNEKLQRWIDFSPLPDFNENEIANQLAEFRDLYQQRYRCARN